MDNDLCLPHGVLGTYSLVGGVLKLAAVTKERKASNCRRDRALWRVSKGRTIGIPTESAVEKHFNYYECHFRFKLFRLLESISVTTFQILTVTFSETRHFF